MEKKIPITIDGKEIAAKPNYSGVCSPKTAFYTDAYAIIPKQPMSEHAVFVWSKWKKPDRLVASCCMPVSPGMVVRTDTKADA